MLLALVAVQVLLFVALSAYLFQFIGSRARSSAFAEAALRAERDASSLGSRLQGAASSCDVLAEVALALHRQGRVDRSFLTSALVDYLAAHPDLYAAWAVFAKDGWDGRDSFYRKEAQYKPDGAYLPWAYRSEGEIVVQSGAEGESDLESYYGDFYTIPMESGKPAVLEPYKEEVGENKSVLMTSYCLPLIENDRRLGVLGIDLALDFISSLASESGGTEGSYACIASSGGLLLGHPQHPDLVGKPIAEAEGPEVQAELEKVIGGGSLRSLESRGFLRVLAPIAMPGGAKPWVLCFSVPEAALFRDRDIVLLNLSVLFAAGLAAMAFGVFLVASRVTKPLASFGAAFSRMEGGDLTSRVIVSTRDEVGSLSGSFNLLSERLASLFGSVSDTAGAIEEAGAAIAGSATRTSEAIVGIRGKIEASVRELGLQSSAEGDARAQSDGILAGISPSSTARSTPSRRASPRPRPASRRWSATSRPWPRAPSPSAPSSASSTTRASRARPSSRPPPAPSPRRAGAARSWPRRTWSSPRSRTAPTSSR
jgi:HAMP domain-containing protein